MTPVSDALQPAEFAATAARAAAACHGLGVREQARRLADDGLLGVISPEDVGGLDLPLDFAVPVVAAGNAGLLGFPLLETMIAGRILQPVLPRVAEAVISGTTLATIAWQGSAEVARKGEVFALNGWLGRVPRAADVDGVLVRVGPSSLAWVPTGAEGVAIQEAAGLDLTVPEHTIHLQHVVIPAANVLGEETWKTSCIRRQRVARRCDPGIGRDLPVAGAGTRLDAPAVRPCARLQSGDPSRSGAAEACAREHAPRHHAQPRRARRRA